MPNLKIQFTLNTNDAPEILGMLPIWALNHEFFHLPLKDALAEQYGMPLYEISGGTLDANGVYRYPGDKPLKPLIRIDRGDETFYQYDYAIVAILSPGSDAYITRMD